MTLLTAEMFDEEGTSPSTLTATETDDGELSYPQKLFVMRHSERVDDLLGKKDWFKRAEPNQDGKYVPFDLNMPSLPLVDRPIKEYDQDTLLTRTGGFIPRLVGRGLAITSNVPDVVYCSPALRCVQTATHVLKTSGSRARIRIEPSLFENLNLYPERFPKFNTVDQLATVYPIDRSYIPLTSNILPKKGAPFNETNGSYNTRIHDTIKRIISFGEKSQKEELNVLIVAHASTVDMAVGLLRPVPRPTVGSELVAIGDKRVPYCSIVTFHREKEDKWVHDMVVPFITYGMFTNRFIYEFVSRKTNERNVTLEELCEEEAELRNKMVHGHLRQY